MSAAWTVERGCSRGGTWFVRVAAARIDVIAPPGVAIASSGELSARERSLGGWRRATWVHEPGHEPPIIELAPPSRIVQLTTREVLDALPAELHGHVRALLERQLASARAFGGSPEGMLIREHRAHAGVAAAEWLRAELRLAFAGWREPRPVPAALGRAPLTGPRSASHPAMPPRAAAAPASPATPGSPAAGEELVPRTVEEFLAALPMEAPRAVTAGELRGSDLLRLLKLRLLGRIARAAARGRQNTRLQRYSERQRRKLQRLAGRPGGSPACEPNTEEFAAL